MHSRCFGLLCLCVVACLGHKDAAKVIDPPLRAEGELLRRERHRGGFALGRYTVTKHALKRTPAARAERLQLELSLDAPDKRRWTTRCDATRARTQQDDYGAVLGESKDALKVRCELSDQAGVQWTFEAEGTLDKNIGGKIVPKDQTIFGGALNVEILMWRKRFNRIRRHLPQPVAQVKLGSSAIAAMVLARPEQAWLATDATPQFQEVALATLAAIDLLPLGLEN